MVVYRTETLRCTWAQLISDFSDGGDCYYSDSSRVEYTFSDGFDVYCRVVADKGAYVVGKMYNVKIEEREKAETKLLNVFVKAEEVDD